VIGAGAAGLEAARSLHALGIDTLVLEARSRIGGRAFTKQTPDGTFPIELGAEFVHENNAVMAALLRETGVQTVEIGMDDEEDVPDVWAATERVLARVNPHAADCSVDAFLKSLQGSVAAEDIDEARMLIEGFDAAISDDAGVLAIAREWQSDANDRQSRLAGGYAPLMQYLARLIDDRIMLDACVERIEWARTGVSVHALRYGEQLQIRARAAVITVPAGVLYNSGIRFSPPLPAQKRKALAGIAMGPVIKVMLQFRTIFWDGGFFQAPREYGFPTVWSREPQQAPVLAAWAGGDAAQTLRESARDPIVAALDACQAIFPNVDVRAQLAAAHYHDWQADPFALGAYSYLRVGAADARQSLGEPLDGVLFFAGEATSGVYAGTVAGALESGARAAAQASGEVL
jgi:monoamine oxidase